MNTCSGTVFIFNTMDRKRLLNILELALRINVFLKLLNYGFGKIIGGQFYRKGAIPEQIAQTPLVETGSYDLAWTFFGHSDGYIWFIGISQLIGAVLFAINRTKLLGGSILVPILLNIIIVDFFFGVAYGAMFSACFYLATVLFVFYRNRSRVIEAIQFLFVEGRNVFKEGKWYYSVLTLLAITTLVFLVEWFFIDLFGYTDR